MHYNHNGRKLDLRGVRGYRRCSKKGKEVGERGRREFDKDNILKSKTT